jgi:hypothetical protein
MVTMSLVLSAAQPASAQPASAQPAAPAGAAPKGATQAPPGGDDADAHFRRGNELYKKERWAEAEGALEEAFRRKKVHDIAANLAYAEMKLGKHREAAEHLAFAVRTWAPTGKEDKRRFAEERLAQVKKEVATLKIRVNVAEAEVLVGGAKVGTSPLEGEVFVDPGAQTVEARKAGYREAKQVVQAAKGAEAEVTLVLEVVPVETGPASEVAAGGIVPSVAPRIDTSQPKGSGSEQTARGGPRKELLIAGGITAGVAAGAGVVLAVVGASKSSDADDMAAGLERDGGAKACAGGQRAAACGELLSLREDASTFTNVGAWMLIGAGIVGAGTLIYWLAAPRTAPQGAVQVTPAVGVRSGGLLVQGAW